MTIVPPRLPVEIKTVKPLVVAEARCADGSAYTDAFRTLEDARQALLERAWISADLFLWTSSGVTPVFMTHAAEAQKWGEAGMTAPTNARSPLMDGAEGLSEALVRLKAPAASAVRFLAMDDVVTVRRADLSLVLDALDRAPSKGRIMQIIEECVWAKAEEHDGVRCIIYDGIDAAADAILDAAREQGRSSTLGDREGVARRLARFATSAINSLGLPGHIRSDTAIVLEEADAILALVRPSAVSDPKLAAQHAWNDVLLAIERGEISAEQVRGELDQADLTPKGAEHG